MRKLAADAGFGTEQELAPVDMDVAHDLAVEGHPPPADPDAALDYPVELHLAPPREQVASNHGGGALTNVGAGDEGVVTNVPGQLQALPGEEQVADDCPVELQLTAGEVEVVAELSPQLGSIPHEKRVVVGALNQADRLAGRKHMPAEVQQFLFVEIGFLRRRGAGEGNREDRANAARIGIEWDTLGFRLGCGATVLGRVSGSARRASHPDLNAAGRSGKCGGATAS